MSQLKLVKTQPLLEEVFLIAEYMYGILAELPEEEEWATTAKLRSSCQDLLYYVALADGNSEPIGAKYDWSSAHKYASALRTLYRFAGKQNFVEFEPSLIVRLDKVIADIDTATVKVSVWAKQLDQQQLADLREKYEISKGIK